MRKFDISFRRSRSSYFAFFFFFNDTATTEIYTLSLHDALPISWISPRPPWRGMGHSPGSGGGWRTRDRKSTRLNSSHLVISYAVFCLKKKKKIILIKQELLLLVYELNRSGLLAANEKLRPIIAH